MQLKLLMDEDVMSDGLRDALLQRGIEVTTVAVLGRAGFPDDVQLEFAALHGWVIFTGNARDFQRLHTEWLQREASHAGIICVPQQAYSIGEQLRRLLRLIAAKSAEEMRNNLEFLSSW